MDYTIKMGPSGQAVKQKLLKEREELIKRINECTDLSLKFRMVEHELRSLNALIKNTKWGE